MRAEYDKKQKKTSVTMTTKDFEVIKQKADNRGLKVSPFMVESARHADELLTPQKKAFMQNLINDACRALEDSEYDLVETLQKEMEKLW